MNTRTQFQLERLIGLTSLMALSVASGQLKLDFSRTGSTPADGFEGYFADHEVNSTFTTQSYTALGSTISVTPIWADDTVSAPVDGTTVILDGASAAKQMIARTEGTPNPALYQDWIGLDGRGSLRAGNPLKLVITGLPSGEFSFVSHHHDPQNQTGLIDITIDDANGPGTPVDFDQSAGGGDTAVPAIYRTTFNANGVDDVVITYSNKAAANGADSAANDFIVINGIEIDFESDKDFDGMPNTYEALYGLDPEMPDANGDLDNDGLTNIQEYLGVDGIADTGDETFPNNSDTDGDGLTDGQEVNIEGSNPLLIDTDGDYFNDFDEVAASTDPTDPSSFTVPTTGLLIDFSSDGSGGQTGPRHDINYLPFVSSDRVGASVSRSQTYQTAAFGGNDSITLNVTFPNPALPDELPESARRLIGRTDGQAAAYLGNDPLLVQDWIGIDLRATSGGNGPDIDSAMDFTITGLPAGKYLYISHHHDVNNIQGDFTVSRKDGTDTVSEVLFTKSGSVNNRTNVFPGQTAIDLPSTSNFIIESAGPSTPVVITYSGRDRGAGEILIAVNGLEIYPTTDTDNDGIPDDFEDNITGLNKNSDDASGDLDSDGLSNLEEYYLKTSLTAGDTDNDGLLDIDELNVYRTDPFREDTDLDGVSDLREINELGSNPLVADSDGDTFGDGWEFLAGSNLTDGGSVPDFDLDGYSASRESNDNDPAIFPMPLEHQLFVDFNSNQNDGGDSSGIESPAESAAALNTNGYESYHANHEVFEEFVTASYQLFGATVTVTPIWPDTNGIATTMQSIGRTAGQNDTWQGDQKNLLADWIGVDTRTSVSGNGAYNGATGTKSRFQLALGNLPGATYGWRSYHHDTENVHSDFLVEVSTDGGTTFTTIAGPNANQTFTMTDGTAGGAPASPMTYTGALQGMIDPADLPSTVEFSFTTSGASDVIIQFTPFSEDAVHRALFGINGFELSGPSGFGSSIAIMKSGFDDSSNYVIDFRGKANTDYQILKSTTLNNDFVPIDLSTDTDGSGVGQFVIPPFRLSETKAFFVIEQLTQ